MRKNPSLTYHDPYRKLNEATFQPFRIRLSNSTAIDVREPIAKATVREAE